MTMQMMNAFQQRETNGLINQIQETIIEGKTGIEDVVILGQIARGLVEMLAGRQPLGDGDGSKALRDIMEMPRLKMVGKEYVK